MGRAERRKLTMMSTLSYWGLEYRTDSVLIEDWIIKGKGGRCKSLFELIRHLCEAKYLHEFCNFDLGYHYALGALRLRQRKFEQNEWFRIIRLSVLLTTRTGVFPETWPWLSGISIADWKMWNDRTPMLCPSYTY